MLQGKTHECVVACAVVRDRHHGCRGYVVLLDDRWYVAHQHAADAAEQCAIRSIALDLFAYYGEDMSAEDAAAVLDKVPRPYVRHLAIDGLEVLVCHRYPFRLAGCAGCSCVHIGFAGEKDIRLALFVALDVRTERLKALVHRHEVLVKEEEIVGRCGVENSIEVMLLAIDSVLCQRKDFPQCTFCRVAWMTAMILQSERLRATYQPQHRVD